LQQVRGDSERLDREVSKTVGALQRRLDDLFDTPPA